MTTRVFNKFNYSSVNLRLNDELCILLIRWSGHRLNCDFTTVVSRLVAIQWIIELTANNNRRRRFCYSKIPSSFSIIENSASNDQQYIMYFFFITFTRENAVSSRMCFPSCKATSLEHEYICLHSVDFKNCFQNLEL